MRFLRHLVLLLLLFPPVAFADSTGWFFGNTGGTMTFNPTTDTLTLTSTITTILGGGIYAPPLVETGDLGTITVTTGPLISGSILHSGIFDGGTITLSVDTGISNGNVTLVPFTMFGTFNNGTQNTPLIWWTDILGVHHLVLEGGQIGFGTITAGIFNGEGVIIYDFHQFAVPTGTNQYNIISGGMTIPEPGTVVLVVTGLGFLAYRTKSRRRTIQ